MASKYLEQFKRWEIGEGENLGGSTSLAEMKKSDDPADQEWVRATSWKEVFKVLGKGGYKPSTVRLTIDNLEDQNKKGLAKSVKSALKKYRYLLR